MPRVRVRSQGWYAIPWVSRWVQHVPAMTRAYVWVDTRMRACMCLHARACLRLQTLMRSPMTAPCGHTFDDSSWYWSLTYVYAHMCTRTHRHTPSCVCTRKVCACTCSSARCSQVEYRVCVCCTWLCVRCVVIACTYRCGIEHQKCPVCNRDFRTRSTRSKQTVLHHNELCQRAINACNAALAEQQPSGAGSGAGAHVDAGMQPPLGRG